MTSVKCNYEDINFIFDEAANELTNMSLTDEQRIDSFYAKLKELETNPKFEYCKEKLKHVSFKLIQDSDKVKNLVKDVIHSGSEKVFKFLNSRGIDLTKPISITKSVSESETPIVEEIKPIDYVRSILPTFPDMKENLEAIIIFLEKLDKNKSGYIDRMSGRINNNSNKNNGLNKNKKSNISPNINQESEAAEAAQAAEVAVANAQVASEAAANAVVAAANANAANGATQGGRRRKSRRQSRRHRKQRKQQKKTRKH